MSKRYSGKSFKDSSKMKKPKFNLKEIKKKRRKKYYQTRKEIIKKNLNKYLNNFQSLFRTYNW